MDIGQPKDFLTGTSMFLKHMSRVKPQTLAQQQNYQSADTTIIGNVLIHPSAKIGNGCCLGPDVVVGPSVVIDDGVRVSGSTLLEGCVIKKHSWISSSVIGWDTTIGKWCRIEGVTVLGEDVQVKDELFLNATLVLPHKGISQSCYERDQIIM
eukprot:c3916_g1_i1.p1 GENE.c3916_g1_i1~~c3916_g1_i1.p1  ORF type:complete len:153 (+),score=41.48 c3916_g1_i1:2-460(+)